jgi:zinc transporter ZupT
MADVAFMHTPETAPSFNQCLAESGCDSISYSSGSNTAFFDFAFVNGTLFTLFAKALVAALTSGLGGFPLYFFGKISDAMMGFSIIFAAGLMTGCSVVLFMEAFEHSTLNESVGYSILGAGAIHLISRCVSQMDDFSFAGLKGANASKALLIVLSMSLHSLGEGISVGVSARSEHSTIGLLVILSLAIHNIPEGVSTSLLLMSRGMGVWQASVYSVIANIPQPLMAIPAFIFVDSFQQLLPIGFGIAAGAMTYIVCTELIPESRDKISNSLLISTFCTSMGIIVSISVCAKHV